MVAPGFGTRVVDAVAQEQLAFHLGSKQEPDIAGAAWVVVLVVLPKDPESEERDTAAAAVGVA